MERRIAKVNGSYLGGNLGEQFAGEISFEMRPDCVYCEWRMKSEDGEWYRAMPVSLYLIPKDVNSFEFALKHAIEGLRRYRLNKQKLFDVERWSWLDGSNLQRIV